MADKSTLADQQERGARAERLLNDDLFKEGLAVMRAETRKAYDESAFDDVALREDCYKMERTIDRFEKIFKLWAITGDQAGKELKELLKSAENKVNNTT